MFRNEVIRVTTTHQRMVQVKSIVAFLDVDRTSPPFIGQTIVDSDQSDEDESLPDERRYRTAVPHSSSALNTSPTWDDGDHVPARLSPLSDRLLLIKL